MSESSKKAQTLHVNLDYRWISLGLVGLIIILLLMWKPWDAKVSDRTIDVTGQATVSARPDKFVFYPTYDFKNANQQTALSEMTAKSNEVVAGLKKVGVADKDIKTNSDSWSYPMYVDGKDATSTYTLRLTVSVTDEALIQKVQDYLVSTTPSGSITPSAMFTETKRKELEDKARDEASKDARKKAEQSAEGIGFRIAGVKAVSDGSGFGGVMPYAERSAAMDATSSKLNTLVVQPGENDLTYTVTVVYYIR